MKLRNKKTGEVVDAWPFYDRTQDMNLKYYTSTGVVNLKYGTLAEFNADWEDYKPAEPLIKDEKVRKAVRAWAEAWGKNRLYKHADNVLSTVDNFVIQFGQTAFIDLEEKKLYTIAELCGEEEE